MEITIDNIASKIMNWCSSGELTKEDLLSKETDFEQKALSNINAIFNMHSDIELVKNGERVYEPFGEVDMLFNPFSTEPEKRILAEIICESLEENSLYEQRISQEINKLRSDNLKGEYKNANKYLISFYHDVSKRNFLHENDFIEIFNNLDIACAIKRIK